MSKKIKLSESQIAMLQQREKDLAKRKVLKITESQYNSIFKKYDKAEEKMDKNIKNLNMEGKEVDDKDINPLEFAQEIIVFIKDIITNPRQVPFSKYWSDLDISRSELFKILKNEGLLTKMAEGDDSTSYSTKKSGFRRGLKKVFNEVNKAKMDLSEEGNYMSGYDDPRDEPMQPDRFASKHESFDLLHYNEESEQLAIFKKDGLLYAINGTGIPHEYIKQYADFDDIVDIEAMNAFVNEEYVNEKIGDEGINAIDKLVDGHLVYINNDIKEHLFDYYGGDIKMVEILNQIPESMTAGAAVDGGGSGPYVGAMSGGAPIKKELSQHSPANEMGKFPKPEPEILGEDLARNQFSVRINLDDNGGDTSPFFDEFYQVQEYMDMLEKKGIVTGVEVSKTDGEGKAKSFVYDFNGQAWEKRETPMAETVVAGASADGGSSGPFTVNGFKGNKFMNAGNEQNKTMPMVKRSVGVNENVERGQVYSSGSGRIRIDRVTYHNPENPEFSDSNTTLAITSWGAGNKRSLNIAPSELGGWTLQESKKFKKILKLTESQIDMLGEVETAYPNGKFVEFDDCTKLDNNKVAQNGGCSQGDDGVVKLSKKKV